MITYTISRHQGNLQYALSNRRGPDIFRLTATDDGKFRWSKETTSPDGLFETIVAHESDYLTAQPLWADLARHMGVPTREDESAITSEQVRRWLREHAGLNRHMREQNKLLSSADWRLSDAIHNLSSLDHEVRHSEKAREALQKAEEARTALAALASSHVKTAQETQK